MWQEFVVGLIVILSICYTVRRYWKKYKSSKSEGLNCANTCESCKERSGCPFDQQKGIRPNRVGIDTDKE